MRNAALATLLLAAAILAACSPSSLDCTRYDVVCVGLVTGVGQVKDNAFNQAAWEGIQQAQADGDVQVANYIETVSAKDYDENIAVFADAGYDIIVTVGAAEGQATTDVAEKYQHVYFIGVDQYQETGAERLNLAGLVFPEDQAGFLAGALAAQMTATNMVGAVLGTDADSQTWRYGEGFRTGALYINPDLTVTVAYHSDADLEDADTDPDWGATMAYTLIDAGADVIFGGPGATGDAALEAAAARGVYAIGSDLDAYYRLPEAAPRLLSSVVKQISPGIRELIGRVRAAMTGARMFPSGNYAGVCSYAPFHDLAAQVPADVEARLDEIEQGLSDGSLLTDVPPVKP